MRSNLPLGTLMLNPPTFKALSCKALGGFGKMGWRLAVLRSACARMRINDHIEQSSHPPKTSHFFGNHNGNMGLKPGRITDRREDRTIIGSMPRCPCPTRVLPRPLLPAGRGDPEGSLARLPKSWVNTVNDEGRRLTSNEVCEGEGS